MKNTINILVAVMVAFSVRCSHAVEVGGITIPEQHDELHLVGAGLLRKGFFFNLYTGALYAASTNGLPDNLTNIAKRLDIHYYHNTPKKLMIRTAHETLKKNLSDQERTTLSPMIEQLHEAYRNGEKGAVASLIHRPENGLTYLYNGKQLLHIDCDRFANAYFSIWLGEYPSRQSMKDALLGLTAKDKDNE